MKRYILLLLCLTIGIAYAQDTLRVRVMTYNLRFGELASLEELAAHIKAFKPDFVALQEVDSKTDRKRAPHQRGKDFISELAYHTGMFGLYGKTIEYSTGYYGIGMLSKYPYISVQKPCSLIRLRNTRNAPCWRACLKWGMILLYLLLLI